MLSNDQLKYHMARYVKGRHIEDIEGYSEAISSPLKYVLHHRMEIQPDGVRLSKQWMIDHDIYYDLDPCMLIFMEDSEHRKLHGPLQKGHRKRLSKEQRKQSAIKHLSHTGREYYNHFKILPFEDKGKYKKEVDYKRYYGFWSWEKEVG